MGRDCFKCGSLHGPIAFACHLLSTSAQARHSTEPRSFPYCPRARKEATGARVGRTLLSAAFDVDLCSQSGSAPNARRSDAPPSRLPVLVWGGHSCPPPLTLTIYSQAGSASKGAPKPRPTVPATGARVGRTLLSAFDVDLCSQAGSAPKARRSHAPPSHRDD